MGSSNTKNFIYSIPLKNSEEPGYSAIYRNKLMYFTNECATYLEVFLKLSYKYPNRIFLTELKRKGLKNWTYEKTRQKLHQYIRFLEGLKIPKSNFGHSLLGIMCKSSPKWILLELACMSLSITTIGLHEHRSIEESAEIMGIVKLSALICSSERFATIAEAKKEGLLPDLENLLVLGAIPEEFQSIKVHNFNVNSVKLIKNVEVCVKLPESDSVYTLAFTSGVTGPLKIVQVTHRNLMAAVIGTANNGYAWNAGDSYFSYIPMSIPMERSCLYAVTKTGMRIIVSSGCIEKIPEEMRLAKPTLMMTIPEMLENICKTVSQEFNKLTGLKRKLALKAIKSKEKAIETKGSFSHKVYDSLVFKKLRASFGGKLRQFVTGVYCMTPGVSKSIKIFFSCDCIEGYGIAEANTCNIASMTGDPSCGHQGGPMSSLEAKLRLIPELVSYYPGPVGELCLRGELVCNFFLDGSEVCDNNGWCRTGDIFTIIPEKNAFQFVARIGNLLQIDGNIIAISKLEAIYRASYFVSQIFIDVAGSGKILGFVVLNEKYVMGLFHNQEEIYRREIKSDEFRKKLFEDLDILSNKFGVPQSLRIKQVFIEENSWKADELVTFTFKLRRMNLAKMYREVLERE